MKIFEGTIAVKEADNGLWTWALSYGTSNWKAGPFKDRATAERGMLYQLSLCMSYENK